MTLSELGKLADLNFDGFENWPPTFPYVNLTPYEEFFFCATFQNFFTLQTFIGPNYNTLWWEKSVIFYFEAPGGGCQKGSKGVKNTSKAQNA